MNEQEIVEQACKIVDLAKEKSVTLRLMGGAAFRVKCPKCSYYHEKVGRRLPDIDYAAYSRQRMGVVNLLKELNYEVDRRYAAIHPGRGHFESPSQTEIDVFYDKLEMCHTISFKDRLELDYPTVPLADMLIQKMQIVEIEWKDIVDSFVLLLEKELGDSDNDQINYKYISKLLSNDWGFYHTVTSNLKKIHAESDTFLGFSQKEKDIIRARISRIIEEIDKEPKSLQWKARSKIGTRKRWYNEVSDFFR